MHPLDQLRLKLTTMGALLKQLGSEAARLPGNDPRWEAFAIVAERLDSLNTLIAEAIGTVRVAASGLCRCKPGKDSHV